MRKKILNLYLKLYYTQKWHSESESNFFKAANSILYPPTTSEYKVLSQYELRQLSRLMEKIGA